MNIELDDKERQLLLLTLAIAANADAPGWVDPFTRQMAIKLEGEEDYDNSNAILLAHKDARRMAA